MNLIGPRVDLQHLRIARELFDVVLAHVAVATVDLHGFHCDFHSSPSAVELHRARFGEGDPTTKLGAFDCSEDHVLNVDARNFHASKLVLNQLELSNRTAELNAFLRVFD